MIDIFFNMWRSHVKDFFGRNVSCISSDVQPPLRISANLKPTTKRQLENDQMISCSLLTGTHSSSFASASYLKSEWSGSNAILVFNSVPGATDSGTTICMGSSLKCGASFSFTTVTATVAVLTGRLGALLLRGATFSTVRMRRYFFCAS